MAGGRGGALAVAVTISSGTWIVGVPELVRRGLDGGQAASPS